jgi:hypothetical protein
MRPLDYNSLKRHIALATGPGKKATVQTSRHGNAQRSGEGTKIVLQVLIFFFHNDMMRGETQKAGAKKSHANS